MGGDVGSPSTTVSQGLRQVEHPVELQWAPRDGTWACTETLPWARGGGPVPPSQGLGGLCPPSLRLRAALGVFQRYR